MKLAELFTTLLLSSSLVESIDLATWKHRNRISSTPFRGEPPSRQIRKREPHGSVFNTEKTAKYAVNGTNIPLVAFDVGESYSGLMNISYKGDKQSDGELFFWFFPSTAAERPKEILIWLNGGPGCSSLLGLLQENGPFQWQPGTLRPVPNPWSFHHLTNVVWIEQPIGTGFSKGTVTATSDEDVARQFMGFWKNFIDTFDMHGYKVFISGESWAGFYCPFIAKGMLDAHDTEYFDVQGMHLIDPVIGDFNVTTQVPAYDFYQAWKIQFPFNQTQDQKLANMANRCGYNDYFNKYLVFPAAGEQPNNPPGANETNDCDLWFDITRPAITLSPGFDRYQVSALAPRPYDPLGFWYQMSDTLSYFNRTDVKKAIHAPVEIDWEICTDNDVYVNETDNSDYTIIAAIPNVVERTKNVIISHGQNDMSLIDSGTLMNIQNMTWNGQRGFSCKPTAPLFVPFHDQANDFSFANLTDNNVETLAAYGILGTTHTERGLTWNHVVLSGHEIPAYSPATAFRITEYLLRRVDSLQSTQPLSNYPGVPQPDPKTFGPGTARPLGKGPSCTW